MTHRELRAGEDVSVYLRGCQEGQREEDGGERQHLRPPLALQQLVHPPGEPDHEEAQQVLRGDQPGLPGETEQAAFQSTGPEKSRQARATRRLLTFYQSG